MSSHKDNGNVDGTTYFIREHGIYVYTAIVALNITITLSRSFLFYKFCMKASQNIHNTMFAHIVYATMRFFNVNPSGRILNRFSKDMGSVDEILPGVLIDSLQIGLSVLGVTVVVCIVNVWMIIVSCMVFVLFYVLRVVFLATSRSIKRLEGVTRSPVFTHLNASLQGLTTIRAFRAEEILRKEFDRHQNLHSASWYLFLACSRAFGYWLDLVCVLYIASVTFSFLLMSDDQYGGNVGLAITQVISLTGMLQWGMRQWSELENQMTSVERVVEYTQIETEPERTEVIPPPVWPENGNIQFKSVFLKYSSRSPYVLKNLNFTINPQEKVGIVGRTGAGKSSLITALFQLCEIEGEILIDDLQITKIPLDKLRCKISIIPQEPVLFSGTLRKNLDPFEEYSDETLWTALEQVQLKQVVSELNLGLNTKMSEGGSNFSVGQRQLVCLARAVIRDNKILILDEATANVDHQTDKLIQETIRKQFINCTVLTIAHRLHTVMDSDKVLVLDAGEIKEFDSPYNLLQNSNGFFYSLVQNTGSSMMENLMKIAREAHEKSA
ncbi:probable multidrug resistance-associated protein lethal(2)03659 [Agrilus planipennis]|nr:probable multidrug resistance-associated protein lethal(2)03659 [Agrilus planipennis]